MPTYLTMDDIVLMHEILIQKFGGSSGIRDKGALESAILDPSQVTTTID